ncbi:MAG: aminodeoxychorismate synthase component I [Gammaproteobacteria bacterium]|nr:aminodeoxychorismate synthase component I [Gammaproteobacteria bacterium]
MSHPVAVLVELEYWADTAQRLHRLSSLPWFVFLDSCRAGGGSGRYDIAAWAPRLTLTTRGELTEVDDGRARRTLDDDPFALVAACLADEARHPVLPFCGGAIGVWGYDLARRVERLPARARRDIDFPDMAVGIYERCLVVDHELRAAWYVHRHCDEVTVAEDVARLEVPRTVTPAAISTDFVVTSNVRPELSFAEYGAAFARIQHYIRAGDCYQVNFTQRFSAACAGDPWDAYQRLRLLNSAPFAGFLRVPQGAVLSSSPERFIEVRDRRVETRPIKGTRARSADRARDAALAAELAASAKDRAENVMIVDLLRNDLGKCCEVGSVAVPHLFDIESFARVHHLVSTVSGRLRAGQGPLDLLRACFPGGSITGAPKVRAMEIIEELEPTRRSVYCGALGYVAHDGQMDTNIAIRTLLQTGERLYCWAGGGIVVDSVLEDEYQESLDKAAAMLNLFTDAEVQALGR